MSLAPKLLAPVFVVVTLVVGLWFWSGVVAPGYWSAIGLGVAWFVHPKGMGFGDVKMALMIGLALGTYVAVALVAAFLFSAVLSLGLLAARGAAARKTGFPFGPFLAAGALVALMWGPELWAWYVGARA